MTRARALALVALVVAAPLLSGCQLLRGGQRIYTEDPHNAATQASLPCGGSMLFAKAGQVWQFKGGQSSPLVTSPPQLTQPAWSPDQSQLALVREGPSFSDIWLAPAGSPSAAQPLTHNQDLTDVTLDHFAYYPSLSPDGVRLAFASSEDVRFTQGSDLNLWILNLQTGASAEVAYGHDYTGGVADVQWRPGVASGNQISYTSYSYDLQGQVHAQVMLFDRASGLSSALTEGLDARQATWSPDGNWMVFTVRPGGGAPPQLWVAPVGDRPVGASTAHQLTASPGLTQPVWCPAGGWIAYLALAGGSFDLWALPVRGSTALGSTGQGSTAAPAATPATGATPAAGWVSIAGDAVQLTAGGYLDARARPAWGAH